jgi:hypothetical protein
MYFTSLPTQIHNIELISPPKTLLFYLGLIGKSYLGHGKSLKNWSYIRGGSYSGGRSYMPVNAVHYIAKGLYDFSTLLSAIEFSIEGSIVESQWRPH